MKNGSFSCSAYWAYTATSTASQSMHGRTDTRRGQGNLVAIAGLLRLMLRRLRHLPRSRVAIN